MVDSGGWGGVTLAQNVRDPAEVDAVLAAAELVGATIGRRGAATFWGGYSGIFVDPDGHPWEIAHNPCWVITDDGRTLLDPRVTGAYAEQTATTATPRPTSLPSVNISVADLVVSVATAADAPGMVDVIHAAFGARPPLDPPSTAIEETPAVDRGPARRRRWDLRDRGRRSRRLDPAAPEPRPSRAGDLAPGVGPSGLPASRHRHRDGRCGSGLRSRARLRPVGAVRPRGDRRADRLLAAPWLRRRSTGPQRGRPGALAAAWPSTCPPPSRCRTWVSGSPPSFGPAIW